MFPRLFHIDSFSLPTYGFMAALGLVLGLWVVVRNARREGIDAEKAWNLGIIAILAAIVGAKVLLVINEWQWYSEHPRQIFSLSMLQAGGVFYGGVIAAVAACSLYIRRQGLRVLPLADIFAPGVALGHAIGRIGCFAAGCCYGKPTEVPWAVTFTNPLAHSWVGTPLNVPLHPTQLYEFIVEMANFVLLSWVLKRKKFEGQVAGAYLFLYGIARFFMEFWRGDPERGSMFGGAITVTQFISILLVIGGGLLWMRRTQARPAIARAAME